jgi:hypothetical protein
MDNCFSAGYVDARAKFVAAARAAACQAGLAGLRDG